MNVLIAESEEIESGGYEVIGLVDSESEARELAAEDMAARLRKLERDEDPGVCPYVYKMYQRGMDGYSAIVEIPASAV